MSRALRRGRDLLFLSDADIRACGVTPEDMNRVIEEMFRAKAEGRTAMRPKLAINVERGQQFQAKAGLIRPDYAAVKWVCPTPVNDKRGIPLYRAVILLNDADTGLPIAMMDGKWITGLRTASITATAAKYLARPDSAVLGVLTGGLQSYTHLDAISAVLPVRKVVAMSRTEASARRFVEHARARGFEAEVEMDPERLVRQVDLLVSSIPQGKGDPAFIDARWLRPGTFLALVDLGNYALQDTLHVVDKMVTDDLEQSAPGGPDPILYPHPFYGEVADLVGGAMPGRENDSEINGVIFSGMGLADVAPAGLIYERAMARGIGTVLDLDGGED